MCSQGLSGKETACNAGPTWDVGLIPGSGRSPGGGNGNALQYSGLENPMDRGDWWVRVHRVTESQTGLKWFIHMHMLDVLPLILIKYVSILEEQFLRKGNVCLVLKWIFYGIILCAVVSLFLYSSTYEWLYYDILLLLTLVLYIQRHLKWRMGGTTFLNKTVYVFHFYKFLTHILKTYTVYTYQLKSVT